MLAPRIQLPRLSLSKSGALALRQFAVALVQMGANSSASTVDEVEERAVISRRAAVLAQPSPLAEAALLSHQVILLSWVELRRRARVHPNPRARPLRSGTTNAYRATVARFRLRSY